MNLILAEVMRFHLFKKKTVKFTMYTLFLIFIIKYQVSKVYITKRCFFMLRNVSEKDCVFTSVIIFRKCVVLGFEFFDYIHYLNIC